MKKITLSQALALKNKIVKRAERAKEDVRVYNTVIEGEEREIDVRARLEDYLLAQQSIVKIKSAITAANGPVQETIYELAELKGHAAFIRSLGTKKKTRASRYEHTEGTIMVAEFAKSETDKVADEIEERIEELQSLLAAHNARTYIEVDETL
jgi:hypothetical protein